MALTYMPVPERLLTPSGDVLAHKIAWARSFLARGKGLLGRGPLKPGDALVLEPAKQVHTIGLRYSIDVVFCTRDWEVLHVVENMAPLRVGRLVTRAHFAVELPGGTVRGVLSAGDRLRLES